MGALPRSVALFDCVLLAMCIETNTHRCSYLLEGARLNTDFVRGRKPMAGLGKGRTHAFIKLMCFIKYMCNCDRSNTKYVNNTDSRLDIYALMLLLEGGWC